MITLDEYLAAEHDVDVRESRMGWRVHAAVYAVVMTGLVVLNLVLVNSTADDFLWFFFPLVGWGFGLAMHYLYAVRWADSQVSAHQMRIEQVAESRHAMA
ncbi:MAG TPA: 2TM domain-containing protein [Nocardioidaceae bacterium]